MIRRLIFLAGLLIAIPASAQEPEIDAFSGFPKTGDWELVRANCIACHSPKLITQQRGTAEQWIKEGKNAVNWTKLSCRTFKDNQTRLQLFALAYNLANFLRRLALPRDVKHWSLTRYGRHWSRSGPR